MTTTTVEQAPTTEKRPGGWRVVAAKEVADHLLSGRFVVLMGVLGIATAAAVFAASGGLRDLGAETEGVTALFLKLFTVAADPVPRSLLFFIAFLGPLLGIMFGFDAVGGERSQGTLPRLLSQPIHRDEVILGKFVAGLAVVTIMLVSLVLFVSGIGIARLGVVPSPAEISRLAVWLVFTIIYIGLWQALATLCSVVAKRAATAVMIPVGIWLVLTVFGGFLVSAVAGIISPRDGSEAAEAAYVSTAQSVSQLSPVILYDLGSNVLLEPNSTVLLTSGLVSVEQLDRALITDLDLSQSLAVLWPQIAILVAMTAVTYAVAYVWFMRDEVRA
jgi:ABC-2 type transport system permease protein